LKRLTGSGWARCRKSWWPGRFLRDGFNGSVFAEPVNVWSRGCDFSRRIVRGNESSFPLAYESKFFVNPVPIDTDEVAHAHLLGGQKVGQRVNEKTLYGALEMTGTVPLVCAFAEQEVTPGLGDAEEELACGCVQDALLDEAEFDVEDGFEFRDGVILPPSKPGLGVTLNEDALRRFKVA